MDDFDLQYPHAIESEFNKFMNFKYRRYDGYVINLSNITQLDEILVELEKDLQWNPRAKYFLHLKNNLQNRSELYQIANNHMIHNLVIISSFNLFTYYPFEVGQPERQIALQNTSKLFQNKIPKTWNNAVIRIDYTKFAPYITGLGCEPGGMEMDLVRTVANILDFTIKFSNIPNRPWGTKYANGSWIFGFGLIQNNKADIGVGFYHLLNDFALKDFDYLYPFMVEPAVWVVPRAEYLPLWLNLIRTFQNNLWFWILACLGITTAFWVAFYWAQTRSYVDVCKSVESPFQFMLEQAVTVDLKTATSQLNFLVWWIFCFITVAMWKSNFVSFLTTVNFDHQIESFEEALQAGLQTYTTAEIAEYYYKYEEPKWIGKIVWDTFGDCNNPDMCFNRTAYLRNTVSSASKLNIEFAIDRMYIDEKGHTKVYVLKKPFNTAIITWFSRKGFPLMPRINDVVHKLFEAGFWNFFQRRFNNIIWVKYKKQLKRAGAGFEILTVSHMKGPLLLLLIALFGSFMVFVFEIIFARRRIFKTRIQTN